MNENDKVNWNDVCPVHNTQLRAQYEFGNKMHPSMVVSVFEGCKCACSHRENDTRYHTSYQSAKRAAIMQKEAVKISIVANSNFICSATKRRPQLSRLVRLHSWNTITATTT